MVLFIEFQIVTHSVNVQDIGIFRLFIFFFCLFEMFKINIYRHKELSYYLINLCLLHLNCPTVQARNGQSQIYPHHQVRSDQLF